VWAFLLTRRSVMFHCLKISKQSPKRLYAVWFHFCNILEIVKQKRIRTYFVVIRGQRWYGWREFLQGDKQLRISTDYMDLHMGSNFKELYTATISKCKNWSKVNKVCSLINSIM
jgi:hypothetical protein